MERCSKKQKGDWQQAWLERNLTFLPPENTQKVTVGLLANPEKETGGVKLT